MALALEAGHHLAHGDGVLDIALQRVAHGILRALKGGADLDFDHRAGMQDQKRAAAQKAQDEQDCDGAEDTELQ